MLAINFQYIHHQINGLQQECIRTMSSYCQPHAMTQGNGYYYSMNSLWMDLQNDAEYEFGVSYYSSYSSYFEDCQANYQLRVIRIYMPCIYHPIAIDMLL